MDNINTFTDGLIEQLNSKYEYLNNKLNANNEEFKLYLKKMNSINVSICKIKAHNRNNNDRYNKLLNEKNKIDELKYKNKNERKKIKKDINDLLLYIRKTTLNDFINYLLIKIFKQSYDIHNFIYYNYDIELPKMDKFKIPTTIDEFINLYNKFNTNDLFRENKYNIKKVLKKTFNMYRTNKYNKINKKLIMYYIINQPYINQF